MYIESFLKLCFLCHFRENISEKSKRVEKYHVDPVIFAKAKEELNELTLRVSGLGLQNRTLVSLIK